MPVSVALIFLLIALFAFSRKQTKLGIGFVLATLVLMYSLSIQPVSHFLAAHLEYEYPAYQGQKVAWVVVLGSFHATDSQISAHNELSRTGRARLSMAVTVMNDNPGATLLVSGYGGGDPVSHAEVMAREAQRMGIPADRIMLAPEARDTLEEAQAWQLVLNRSEFALVTSAMHIPRAMYLFESLGLSPIAAPANYEAIGTPEPQWRHWLPKARNLYRSEAAWHEYLGLTWARLNNAL